MIAYAALIGDWSGKAGVAEGQPLEEGKMHLSIRSALNLNFDRLVFIVGEWRWETQI